VKGRLPGVSSGHSAVDRDVRDAQVLGWQPQAPVVVEDGVVFVYTRSALRSSRSRPLLLRRSGRLHPIPRRLYDDLVLSLNLRA
jgi:hypothetical protein